MSCYLSFDPRRKPDASAPSLGSGPSGAIVDCGWPTIRRAAVEPASRSIFVQMCTIATIYAMLNLHRKSAVAHIGPTQLRPISRVPCETDQEDGDCFVGQIDWPS
jgi:hypothetical protein